MALLAEYAITPDVFDVTCHSSEEVCGLHLQSLKELLVDDGLLRDLRDGAWGTLILETERPWHRRAKELLKKLGSQKRLVPSKPARKQMPSTDAEWCEEALASHVAVPLVGIVATDGIAAAHRGNVLVSSVARLPGTPWWQARGSSHRLPRTLAAYQPALELVLRHANSLLLVDPYIDPSDAHQYSDLLRLLGALKQRSSKPLVEIHRASWYGPGNDKRPAVGAVVAAVQPMLAATARETGMSFEVFLWDEIHDRYLISDLIGINLPNGFSTTRAPGAMTTWTRLDRRDRDAIQRDIDPAYRTPRHRFKVP